MSKTKTFSPENSADGVRPKIGRIVPTRKDTMRLPVVPKVPIEKLQNITESKD